MFREGGLKAMTHEPGDLPSFVVTREGVGRGAPRRSSSCLFVRRHENHDLSQ